MCLSTAQTIQVESVQLCTSGNATYSFEQIVIRSYAGTGPTFRPKLAAGSSLRFLVSGRSFPILSSLLLLHMRQRNLRKQLQVDDHG
jgi:hypothetical protein